MAHTGVLRRSQSVAASRLRRRHAVTPSAALLTGRGTAASLRAFRERPTIQVCEHALPSTV
jgi:hypothetical protein